MAKAKTFADKMAKSALDFHKHCSKCGEALNTIQLVVSERSATTGSWRFNEKYVGVCKCNEKEVIR
jgi:hypothetical protein